MSRDELASHGAPPDLDILARRGDDALSTTFRDIAAHIHRMDNSQ